MSDECAAILKEYSAYFDSSQSDVLYLFARAAIHNHALNCKKVDSILALRNKCLDKRVHKPCFGFACLACQHVTACTTGVYKGVLEVKEGLEHLVKEDGPLVQEIKRINESSEEPGEVPCAVCAKEQKAVVREQKAETEPHYTTKRSFQNRYMARVLRT
tara:strand:+ start:1038 stop:1514 length:477 start_codon:yes stop_codon:yes gene_type:complete